MNNVGYLVYIASVHRYFLYSNGKVIVDGFHCGDCLQVRVNGVWVSTRFEHDCDWYLVGLPDVTIDGLVARI